MRKIGALGLSVAVVVAIVGQAAPEASPHAAAYREHAVAADTPAASQAGADILAAGGNAADAAAATMLALGASSPASSGLGGGGFLLYYRASDRTMTFLDFRETAPASATDTMFARRTLEDGTLEDDAIAAERSRTGGLAVAVPGEPAGIEELIRRFGSGRLSRAQIAAPAERLAREGAPASRYVSEASARVVELLRADPITARWLTTGTERIERGAALVDPELAATLRTFGREGARAFYRGSIAREIVASVRAHGGTMTMADLAAYRVRERTPLETVHQGRRWVSSPPPSAGGFTILHSLALLDAWRPSGGWHDGPAFRHALSQSWIGAYSDRAQHLGDPDHADIPVDRLLDRERLAARAALFDPERARPAAEWEAPITEPAREGGTSHLCVVDREGNVAAVTTTINLEFGARISAAGMLLNDEMDDFARELGAPNAFGLPGGAANLPRPGRRPVSSMSPTLVLSGDAVELCIGASGGSRIPTATEQVALLALEQDVPIGEAVARRRMHHQGVPTPMRYEAGVDVGTLLSSWRRGHDLEPIATVANVQAIRIVRRDDGTIELHAASDPRKDGEPRGR
jgi:gamma-glutamyltranspeptidase/glutathione hydrolase